MRVGTLASAAVAVVSEVERVGNVWVSGSLQTVRMST